MNLLRALARADDPRVLVTVAATRGSTPREAGAQMLIGRTGADGSIGGGTLELQATQHARALLDEHSNEHREWSGRLSLGARLGQCCGGQAELLFEVLPDGKGSWAEVVALASEQWVMLTGVDDSCWRAYISASRTLGNVPSGISWDWISRQVYAMGERSAAIVSTDGNAAVLVAPVARTSLNVVLFGAGHVGHALIAVLGNLPFDVTVIDDRPDRLPSNVPANICTEFSRAPELEVDAVPPGSACLVMTYSHALDRRVCERLLARDDLCYVGLIGSGPKRRSFEQHWRKAGMDEMRMRKLVCPIGIELPGGKSPGVIAVATAAQLLGLVT
jgi:xanthine dehydrogenase accessory factor